MRRRKIEAIVVLFVLVGCYALGYLVVRLGNVPLWGDTRYALSAVFPSAGGLQPAAIVEIAGVKVGWVETITLRDYDAEVTLHLEHRLQVPDDTLASIRTRGVLGEKYVLLTPGNSQRLLPSGGHILKVEAALDIETLIGRFIQGKL